MTRFLASALAATLVVAAVSGCSGGGATVTASTATTGTTIPVTIASAKGAHVFKVEVARSPEDQEKGLMFRTDIPKDGGMIFTPYPADGGPPRAASFWMKNTPTPLDIIFIRPDGTIATIAENTVPFSEAPVPSGEPVAAVLEILGGRSAELGIAEGDTVSWAK
jgi:uncharacterized membrane protein (UPF0127 family)